MAANVPAMGQEAIVDCFAFFYEEGNGGENFRKKNKFRCKVKKEERSLQETTMAKHGSLPEFLYKRHLEVGDKVHLNFGFHEDEDLNEDEACEEVKR